MKEPIVPGYTVEKIQEFAENKITKKGIGLLTKIDHRFNRLSRRRVKNTRKYSCIQQLYSLPCTLLRKGGKKHWKLYFVLRPTFRRRAVVMSFRKDT